MIGELLDKQPPCNLEAERGVLGSILLLPEVCDDVAAVLKWPTSFYDDANQKIYQHLLAMREAGERIDLTLLVNRLKDAGTYDAIGGAAYLAEVVNSVPTAANAVYYAQIVSDKARLRVIADLGAEMIRNAYKGMHPDCLATYAEAQLSLASAGRLGSLVTADEAIEQALERARQSRIGGPVGLPTGLIDLDHQIGGLVPGELIVLAARPRVGKSALGMQVATLTAQSGERVLVCSLEMSASELMTRGLCAEALIDSAKIRSGRMTDGDVLCLEEAGQELHGMPLMIDDRGSMTVADIRRTARHAKGLALVVVDHLQLIEPDEPRANRNDQLGQMTKRLKQLAKEMSVPVLLLCQLNRQSETSTDHRPRLGHLRESGNIEQDADMVLLLHRAELHHDDPDLKGQAELIVAKNRNGPTPTIELNWDATTTTYRNAATYSTAAF